MRFDDYFEISEKAGWRATDLDWRALDREVKAGLVDDFDRQALVGTAVIEHGVPHYGEVWTLVEDLRAHWDLWQFTTLWTGEEHRHSYVLKRACDAVGCAPTIAPDIDAVAAARFAALQKKSCPTDCYRTVPGMLTYAMIQELATQKFYDLARRRSRSPFLQDLFRRIAGDEMRHHVFFREALGELHGESADKAGFCEQVYRAARAFKMPHLIYGLQVEFFEHGDWSMGTLGTLAFRAQLARCFSFSPSLLARLLRDKVDAEIDANGSRTVVGAAARP